MGNRDPFHTVVAVLQALRSSAPAENQPHILDGIEPLQMAREKCGLDVATCSQCDAHCGDLNQP
jgi:hypothetical protein